MEIILNGDKQNLDPSEYANLAELIGVAERSLAEPETFVLVGVEVNGKALEPEELAALESRSLEGVEKVAIHERLALDVARSVLAQAADYTGQICEAIEGTVSHYRSSRSDRGGKLLADVTDSMSILTGITYSVSSVLVEESAILADLQAEIYPWLEELVEAQSVQDPIRIADTLEYEISPRVADWGATMRNLLAGTHALNGSTESPHSN